MECPLCHEAMIEEECFEEKTLFRNNLTGKWKKEKRLVSGVMLSCVSCYSEFFLLKPPNEVDIPEKFKLLHYHSHLF